MKLLETNLDNQESRNRAYYFWQNIGYSAQKFFYSKDAQSVGIVCMINAYNFVVSNAPNRNQSAASWWRELPIDVKLLLYPWGNPTKANMTYVMGVRKFIAGLAGKIADIPSDIPRV